MNIFLKVQDILSVELSKRNFWGREASQVVGLTYINSSAILLKPLVSFYLKFYLIPLPLFLYPYIL